ncbi:hypothetical protein Syun_005538 [Stephania yunnanensis]|uniref:GDSL esterase/lipase n=1 Tax=Stephania yunnanensis TaxID=152371 RepID=A0AAP0Q617_9MAGN
MSKSKLELYMSSLLFILALSVFVFPCSGTAVDGPALFMFGDSSLDVGTNNYINTRANGNNPPYGIDFPGQCGHIPTGRFSNGFNIADFLGGPALFIFGDLIIDVGTNNGLESMFKGNVPPYGIDFPGSVATGRFSNGFSTADFLGEAGAKSLLNNSIIFINAGSIAWHWITLALSLLRPRNSLPVLEMHWRITLRKFDIASFLAIGCCPAARAGNDKGECSVDLNVYPQSFHSAIVPMLQNLSSELTGMKYALGNVYHMMMNYLNNPSPSGPTELRCACCGGGKLNAEKQCDAKATVCKNRDKYLFWDAFHPSQAAATIPVETLYNGTTEFVTPINLKQLNEDY